MSAKLTDETRYGLPVGQWLMLPGYGQKHVKEMHERIAALTSALERLRDPAPGVGKLPPWAYGVIVPALKEPT